MNVCPGSTDPGLFALCWFLFQTTAGIVRVWKNLNEIVPVVGEKHFGAIILHAPFVLSGVVSSTWAVGQVKSTLLLKGKNLCKRSNRKFVNQEL